MEESIMEALPLLKVALFLAIQAYKNSIQAIRNKRNCRELGR
jgi:hypothetical protein